jgi:predicted aldo/keto reductase-like oxidoreductase
MEEAGPVLHKALDMGINFFDTARVYSDSEAKIGRHIADRRGEYYLATKSLSRTKAEMARDIDMSLDTMRTDHIDLYQIHNIRRKEELTTALGEGGAYEALKEAQAAGKIKFIGVTGHSVNMLVEAVRTNLFDTVQVPFNVVEQEALQELFPLAKELDVGTIIMKPLGGGLLPRTDLALRFIVEHGISVIIPGMDRTEQVVENFASLTSWQPLTAQEREWLLRDVQEIGQTFCRRCGYCLPCSVGIDIPSVFILHLQYTRYKVQAAYNRYHNLSARAEACTACGACEQKCPYNLPIREKLHKVAGEMGLRSGQ